jgi:hypothetical protein
VLALLGGAFGMLLALWSSDLLIASIGPLLPFDIAWQSGASAWTLIATFAFCVLATFAFAFGPALRLSRASSLDHLKGHAGEDVVRRRSRFLPRNPLVALQIACSVALLTAAFLFVRGAGKAATVETGLKPGESFLVELDASLSGYDRARARQLYGAIEQRLAALPGVETVSISATVPFGMVRLARRVERAGAAPSADVAQALRANFNSVGADYFNAVGLPLLRGRGFTAAEATQPGGPAVAVIDEVLAKKLWPEGDALGQHLQLAGPAPVGPKGDSGDLVAGEGIEIVGIVPAVRHAVFEKQPGSALYLPFARGFQNNAFFFVRFKAGAHTDDATTADLLRRTIREVDPALPVLSLKSFAAHLNDNLELWMVRAAAALFSGLRRARARPLRCRVVWREGVFGRASHSGDRDPYGARRPTRHRPAHDPARRRRDVNRRPRLRSAARARDRPPRQQYALRSERRGSDRVHRCTARAGDRRFTRHLGARRVAPPASVPCPLSAPNRTPHLCSPTSATASANSSKTRPSLSWPC